MTAPYEVEVRVRLPRVEAFRAQLSALGGRRMEAYTFTDYYYQPRAGRWSPVEKSLRVRAYPSGDAEVLYTRIELITEGGVTFKRSSLPQGKASLGRGTLAECRALLDDLGFNPWLCVRKLAGEVIEVPGVGTIACEQIEGHGWWLELEVEGQDTGEASARLRSRLAALGIDVSDASPLPMAALVGTAPRRRVYFCGAIRGGRRLQARYARFIAALEAGGWIVLTAHVGAPDVLEVETRAAATDAEIYRRDMAWMAGADVVVAEVSVPSLGVGIEIATALANGLPVIALAERDASVSALIGGDPRITLIRYENESDAVRAAEDALTAAAS